MRLLQFLTQRLLISAVTLIGVSLLIFVAMRLMPGGFEDIILGPFASDAARAATRARYGLDQPVLVQYGLWLKAALGGDLGSSMISQLPVADEILRRAPATIQLAVMALLIAIIVGVPLGVVSAVGRKGNPLVPLARGVGVFGLGVPDFVLGAILVYLFSRFQLGLNVGGFVPLAADWQANLRVMTLPAITLGAFGAAQLQRVTDVSAREVMTQPHILAAIARGDAPGTIIVRHVLRNASIPVLTAASTFFGYLLGGTIVVEQLFSVPGIGQYVITALTNRDYAVVQAGVLVGASFFLAISMIADIAYAVLDPRVGDPS
ncbi:ABC transporter permease [Devosia epidermidihirudinis]|uniref:ABC transporter permease n=1 Tax=Devosia epidermidihirudinis TaxID=1293439 RepID=A0A0F5Q5L6_9HYPH|nr:ABC transporter permease [Devosia epidermidihirudinis]KKC35936.1 ABC transporter permease [Devosia epidermidihirudinis]